jgi:rhodanese-related sulfurtransferase
MSPDMDQPPLEIDPDRVSEWLQQDPDLQLIDVREPYEHDAGHIEKARLIELVKLSTEASTLDPERPVVFYCRVGGRSLMAAQALRVASFNAYSMAGGLARWASEGKPLSPEGGTVADH